MARGTDFQRVERLLPISETDSAHGCWQKLQIKIARHRIRRAREIHLHRMIHGRGHRHERLRMILDFSKPFATAVRNGRESTSNGTPVKSCNTMRATTREFGRAASRWASIASSLMLASFGHFFAVAICGSTVFQTREHGLETGRLEIGRRQRLPMRDSE